MAETTGGHSRVRVARGDARIEVLADVPGGDSTAPALVLLPSLARGAEDFAPLLPGLLAGGLRVLRPQPRGIGGSTGPLDGLTLHDLAADVGAAIEALGAAPAFVAARLRQLRRPDARGRPAGAGPPRRPARRLDRQAAARGGALRAGDP